ncbi:hypothetical protein [Litorilituus lipolyticus]|uniref:Uncharacterized protein n=1 Tax=Litorilituus lipolyticus TaxID=2491017 RepID=A0A502L004_9GAMM|nr:hypothetical protein [Litorilituus lipolyticus]TPH15571.1 hypothetical protein EPA86_08295 [Litorilituus lipolyticus]
MTPYKWVMSIAMLVAVLLPEIVYSQSISINGFVQAQKDSERIEVSTVLKDVSALTITLQAIDDYETRLLATERAFRLLTKQSPTLAHKSWLNAHLSSSDVLFIPNPDHPEQQLEVVNIAKQAKAVLTIWHYQEKAQLMEEDLAHYRWQWSDFIAEKGKAKYSALSLALKNADEKTLQWLQGELINTPSLSQADNQLLVLLASFNGSTHLVEQVWRNEADQYSFQLLQGIEQLFSEEETIKQLTIATHNQRLASQAILKLAKEYIDHEVVQNKLVYLLGDDNSGWHAAMAVCASKYEEMIDKLTHFIEDNKSPAVLYVKACVKENS